MIPVLLIVLGVLLVVAGVTMVVRGLSGRAQVQHELAQQKITFPAVDKLPAALAGHAGALVTTGGQARAYADLIGAHVARATAGRTYAQIAEECQSSGRTDERLTRLRETAFMGQTLRGSLLGAYQAWQVTTLVVGLGGLLTAMGLVFLTLATAWH